MAIVKHITMRVEYKGKIYTIDADGDDISLVPYLYVAKIEIYAKDSFRNHECCGTIDLTDIPCFPFVKQYNSVVVKIDSEFPDVIPFDAELFHAGGYDISTVNGKKVVIIDWSLKRGGKDVIVAKVSSEDSINENIQLYYYDGTLVSNVANNNLKLIMRRK
jgi:hypothetical protein